MVLRSFNVFLLLAPVSRSGLARMPRLKISIYRMNARSVTGRIFTEAEQADHHCAIVNIGLALDVMLDWLETKSSSE
jgi:hypothetical protein